MELKDVFEPIIHFLKTFQKKEKETVSKDKAKERLQLVLMQDRASVSPDFFEMMKKEIIEVIKKYIEIDEEQLEVQLTRGFEGEDGTGPALYANIPIKNIKPVAKKVDVNKEEKEDAQEIANNIIEDIKEVAAKKQEELKGDNIDKEESAEETVEEAVEEANTTVIDTIEEKKVIDKIEQVVEEVQEEVEEELQEETEKTQTNIDNIKDKYNNFKDGAKEKISKAKSQAKDGINKIKSKVKAKN